MNNQYLQWIIGSNRGNVEPVELTQDSQTFEDFAVLSNGQRIPMSKLGKDFIVIPTKENALGRIDLDMMYPIESPEVLKQKRVKSESAIPDQHMAMLGLERVKEKPTETQSKKSRGTFSSDLLLRSKKSTEIVPIELEINLPTKSFFKMINETFDESTVNEVIDIIVESVSKEEINNAIKNSITKIYGEKK